MEQSTEQTRLIDTLKASDVVGVFERLGGNITGVSITLPGEDHYLLATEGEQDRTFWTTEYLYGEPQYEYGSLTADEVAGVARGDLTWRETDA